MLSVESIRSMLKNRKSHQIVMPIKIRNLSMLPPQCEHLVSDNNGDEKRAASDRQQRQLPNHYQYNPNVSQLRRANTLANKCIPDALNWLERVGQGQTQR